MKYVRSISGTHWTWEIVGMLYQGRADTISKSKVVNMVEAAPWDSLEKQESPRVYAFDHFT